MGLDLLKQIADNEDVRERAADRIRVAADFELPILKYWNYDPCEAHAHHGKPVVGCQYRRCGLIHRKHQRIGSAWLYVRRTALLADVVGSGKTAHAGTVIAMMKESGEMDHARVIVIVRSPAVLQWLEELQRMLPSLEIRVAIGQRDARYANYLGHWDVMVIGQHMFLRDYEQFDRHKLAGVFVDDVDALRNRTNRTAYVIKRAMNKSPRRVIMTGTPLQKKLHELHSVLEPLGGTKVLGKYWDFMNRYVRFDETTYGKKIIGYKNMEEFKLLISPFALRRTADDIDDVDLPEVVVNNVLLDLYPAQRHKYGELQQGVFKQITEKGTKVKHVNALTMISYGARICAGMAALGEPDGPNTSVKFDWIMEALRGDLSEDKVVIFAAYLDTVKALQKRMRDAGIGFTTIWGPENDKIERKRRVDQFWSDPKVKVLIGTQAIEQSLNLQVARHLINVDMILNPARMEQLAGRIRRDGSAFKHVYVHNLLTYNTQEERYLPLLEREQALIDYVWDENSELFQALNVTDLMGLITG